MLVSNLISQTVTHKNRVETFVGRVIIFEKLLERFKLDVDLTKLVLHGEESTLSMERLVVAIVRVVENALAKGINGEQGGLQTWSNGLIALSKMATALSTCKIKEVTLTLKLRMYDEIADGMLHLVPMISNFEPGLTTGQIAATSTVRLRVVTLQEALEQDGISRFRVVRGRMDEVFGL